MSFEKSAREKLEVHLEMERKWALWKEKIHKIEKKKARSGTKPSGCGKNTPEIGIKKRSMWQIITKS
jgi:hypothetical protein